MFKIIFIIFTASLFFISNAFAVGHADLFEVKFVRIDKAGIGYVEFSYDLRGTPAACTKDGYTRALAFDVNKPGGEAILAAALAAQASGKKILARGTGACSLYHIIEDWQWGYIQ